MRLTRLITLHWGNLDRSEWDFPEMTLLTGETGSGKSTLLDAIQTVLTATYAGVFFYNPGQEESTQASRKKEKRTLPDYCLGREGTELARDSAHTYLACVFQPSPGEENADAFTAIVAIEAIAVANRAEQSRLGLYLARARELRVADFLRGEMPADGPSHLVEVRDFWAHLQRKFGRDTVSYFSEDKGEYLRALYGAFRGQPHVSENEALRAARAVVKAMAYKPVGSIDELVKGELLEEHDLSADLRQVGDLLRDIRDLSDEAERLNRNIEHLERAKGEGELTLTTLADYLVHEAAASRRVVLRDEDEQAHLRVEVTQALGRETQASAAATELLARIGSKNESASALQAKLSKIPAWTEQERLNASVSEAERTATDRAQILAQWLRAVGTLVEWGRKVETFLTEDLSTELRAAQFAVREALGAARRLSAARLAEAIGALPQHSFPLEQTRNLARETESLAQPAGRLFDALMRDEASFAEACGREVGRLQFELKVLENESDRLAAILRRLEAGRSVLPPGTARVLAALSARLPHAKPQILAELIETRPGSVWQNAIEGFMGGDRFIIVVDESAEQGAIDLLRSEFAHEHAKVIQGRRAKRDAVRRDLPTGSILEELVIEHPTAAAYMRVAYGNVMKVANTQALLDVNRGLTAQGHAAANYTLFVAWTDDDQLALGHPARERARQLTETKWRETRRIIEIKKSLTRDLQAIAAALRKLVLTDSHAAMRELAHQATTRAEAVAALARLDFTDAKDLSTALEEVRAELVTLNAAHARQLAAAAEHGANAKTKSEQADKLERALPEKRTEAANHFARFVLLEECVAHRAPAHELGARAEILAADATRAEQALRNAARFAANRMAENYGAFLGTLGEYNANAREPERLSFERERLNIEDFERAIRWLVLLLAEIDRQLKLQRDIGIAQNRDRLKEAEGRFNHVFTSDFCFKIHSRVNAGVSALRELNRELEHLTFGRDRFTLDWNWVPEYQEYHRFFSAVHDRAEDPAQKSIFDPDALDPELAKVRDILKTLLLDKNRERADKRLKEIADYRNYRTYEIWRDTGSGAPVALSKWGTGSGGELETPFYIVRSAVLSSALRFFTKEGTHLRLMLSDEAFAKMDESRRRAVIRYLRQALRVQFIVAMPTSNSGSVKPEFDKEFTFAKVPAVLPDGREWIASEAQEKELKREPIQTLWQSARDQAAAHARADFFAENPGARVELEKT